MILERGVPKNRITEVPYIRLRRGAARHIERVDWNLDADRRLKIEIAPAFAARNRRLRGRHISGNFSSGAQRIRHLEEGRHDIIAVFCSLAGGKTVFDQERRPIANSRCRTLRAGSGNIWWRRQNHFPVIGRDELDSCAARSAVIDKTLAVSLATTPVFLIVLIVAKLLLEARCDCHKRGHPVRLRGLGRRNHIEPGANGAPGG